MNTRELILVFLVALLLLSMGFWIGRSSASTPTGYHPGQTAVKRDTVVKVVPAPPVVIHDAPVRVRVKREAAPVLWIDSTDSASMPDTVGVVRPFETRLDTIIHADTITATFSFPPPRQSLVLRPGPDSVITHTITVTQDMIREPSPFEKIGWGAVGAAVGAGIILLLSR